MAVIIRCLVAYAVDRFDDDNLEIATRLGSVTRKTMLSLVVNRGNGMLIMYTYTTS